MCIRVDPPIQELLYPCFMQWDEWVDSQSALHGYLAGSLWPCITVDMIVSDSLRFFTSQHNRKLDGALGLFHVAFWPAFLPPFIIPFSSESDHLVSQHCTCPSTAAHITSLPIWLVEFPSVSAGLLLSWTFSWKEELILTWFPEETWKEIGLAIGISSRFSFFWNNIFSKASFSSDI